MKKKDLVSIGAIVVVIVSSTILFFFPSIVGYDKSYVSIGEKKEQFEENNNKMTANEAKIEKLKQDMETSYDTAKKKDEYADLLESKVNEDDFVLNKPALLITMDQEAKKNNVDLHVEYSKIVSSDSTGSPNVESDLEENKQNSDTSGNNKTTPDTNVTVEENNQQQNTNVTVEKDNQQQNTEQRENGTDTTTQNQDDTQDVDSPKNKGTSFTDEEISKGTVVIEGMQTTVVPIQIKGTYADISNYIEFLDTVGLIKPSSVYLESKGNKLQGKVILNVIHGEVKR